MSIKSRKDNRSILQFSKDIKLHTLKELYLMKLWAGEMGKQGYSIRYEDYGCGNNGELLTKSNNNPDYKIWINGKEKLLEIKNSPSCDRWTFKLVDLKSYIKQGASILIVWGTGRIEMNPSSYNKENTRYGIISTKKIKKMLEYYTPYKERLFGFKICICVPKTDFNKWVKIRKIS